MKTLKIAALLVIASTAACGGGGGGGGDYSGKWHIKLMPEANESSAHCVRNPQPIDEIVTVNQTGESISVYFDSGDVLMNAGDSFPGRLDPDSMIAGRAIPVSCPRGYSADLTQTLVFNCPPGDTCAEVARVQINGCPTRDYMRDDSIIRDSPSCVTTWRGTGEKIPE